MLSVHHSAVATSFPAPSSGKNSDTVTHNINLSITVGANMKISKPDGLGLVRYRAPDIESFTFDHDKGYRFDPSTGLHYDANSRFFINYELGILLCWDRLSNTYRRAGDVANLRPAGKVLPWDSTTVTVHNLPAFHNQEGCIHEPTVEADPKRNRIFEVASRSQSDSVPRHRHDSKNICFGRRRSQSRSGSSDKKPKTGRPRTRSAERRRGRKRHRSNSRDARRNDTRMSMGCSRSPSLHNTERQRRSSRSASSDKQPRTRQSRSKSVERIDRRRGTKRHRSTSRGARRKDSQMSCSRSPSLHKSRIPRTSSTHHDREWQDSSQPEKMETKRGVWNRLGPSIKKESSGSRSPSDSEWGIQTSMKTRIVHFVRTYDSERSRSHSSSRDSSLSLALTSTDDESVFDENCRDIIDDESVRVDEALDSTDAKPTKNHLGPFDSQPKDQQSRDEPTPNQRTASVEGSKLRNPHFDKNHHKMNHTAVALNAADSESSKKRPKKEVVSDVGRHKRSHSPNTQTRRIDISASRSKSNSPERQREDSVRLCVDRSKYQSIRTSKQSTDGSYIRKSVNRIRSLSIKNIKEVRRSRSREPRTYHIRGKQGSGFKALRRSLSWGRRKSCCSVIGRNHYCSRNSSFSSADEEFVFNDTEDCDSLLEYEAPDNRAHTVKDLGSRDYSAFDSQQEDKSRDKPAFKRKRTSTEGNITDHNMKLKSENAVESHSAKKQPKEEVMSDVEQCKRSRSPKTRTSRIDVSALRSIYNSPARHREDSGRVCVGRSVCRSTRSSERSRDGSNVRRSVTRVRNQSRTNIKGARRSRSWGSGSDHSRGSQRCGFRPLRSCIRGSRRNDSRGSKRSGFRESTRRSSSRGGRKSPNIVTRRNHSCSRDSSSLSLSSTDDEFVSRLDWVSRRSRSRVTRMSSKRELKGIYCSPSRMEGEPSSRNSSINQRNPSSDRTGHGTSHSRGTMRKRDVQNQHDPSPIRRELESRGDSRFNSNLAGGRLVGIDRSHTNSANSQDSSSISHESTNLDTRSLPESKAPEPREKTPDETPTVVITSECDDPEPKNYNPEKTPKAIVIDKPCPKDEVPVPTGKNPEEAPEVVATDKPSAEYEDPVPRKDKYEETHKVVVIDKPLAANEALKPREESPTETPEVVIDTPFAANGDAEPTGKRNPEGTVVTIIDNGDVLGHLFTNDENTKTNIILVAPLPLQNHSKNASDALKNQIEELKDVLRVYISYENTSGSPCRFMVVSFKTAYGAKQWYDSVRGTIVLNGEGGLKMKAYLHFLKKGNWNCKHCRSFNFFMQSLCSKCYLAKGSGFSPVTISEEPTKWVGIARLKSNFSTTQSVTDSLPPLHTFNILSVEMIREASGLSLGLCVFEVGSNEEGSRLHEFFLQQERNAIYVVVNEKPKTPDEEYLSLLFDKMTPTNILLVAVIPRSTIPDIRFELSIIKTHLLMLLKEDDVKHNQITLHVDENVGAPYSYALITFADTETAADWLKSRQKTFHYLTGQYHSSPQTSMRRSDISVYFSEENWKCLECHAPNFSLRSLCHQCFKHREPNKLGPISQSLTTTRVLAVPEISSSSWSKTDEYIVAGVRELLKEFILKRVEVIRDSECPSLPLACAIETQCESESLRLKEYLTKEGRFSVFVVLHSELNEHTGTNLSNVADVMIVEAPPPECIDLTCEDDPTPTTEITFSPEVVTQVLEERPAECIDLTSEVNLSQLTEEVDTSCSLESGTPDVEKSPLATSVNPTSEADLCQNTEIACSPEVMLTVCAKPPPASMDVTSEVTKTNEKAAEKTTCFPPVMAQSDVISVSPVPRLRKNTQWHCAVAFLNCGAEYKSVEYCQGNLFGVSYNYCLVYFTSAASATEWYSKCRGSIKITNKAFPNSNRKLPSKAFLNFSESNWLCDCGKENCHIRSICFGCFKKRGETLPIFVRSLTPTKYLAIKLFKKYEITELAVIFPKMRCTMFDVVNIKFLCDPRVQRDNFGIYILETRSLEGAIALWNYYKKSLVVQSTSYVVLKDLTAGTVIDLGLSVYPPAFPGREENFGNTDCGNGMHNAPSAVSDKPEPDYAAIIWTSLYGFHLVKPLNNFVMISLCLDYRELPDRTRVQIQDSLNEAEVTSGSIIYSFKGDVGSPFSYCLISFDSLDTAKKWFDKCSKDTFQFEICHPDDQKLPLSFQNCYSVKKTSDGGTSYFIKSKLYYSQPNWICNCGTSNFPLRSVCHACFKNKNKESGYSVSDATKFVGIKLTECLETVDTSTLYDVRNYGYDVSKINIGLDPALPKDPFGIVIFEMQSLNEGIKFRRFLANLNSNERSCKNRNDGPTMKKLMKILSTSSGVTFLIPYQK